MAGKLLKETKDIEIKKKKRNNKINDDNIYKIDLDIEQDETQNKMQDEIQSVEKMTNYDEGQQLKENKKAKTRKTKAKNDIDNNIRKIEDDDDEIDEIFGNVNRWLKDGEDEIAEKKPRKRLTKIEEGIKSSKATKAEKTTKTKKATSTRTKTKGKAEKITKTEIEINSEEIERPTVIEETETIEEVERISEKQSEIKMYAANDLTEIVLKKNRYKIEFQKAEYNIYTDTNETSYIIVRDPGLRIVSGGVYILVEKQGEDYEITTNQDFKINYVIDNLERKNNIVNFKLTNLTEIAAYEDGLVFEIDEEKVIENNLEDNNTLVISEEDGKVYLPYTKEDIKNEIVQNKGTKISEVIEDKYILPLDKYKNSMRARFREGYNLMYRKEGKSKKSAIMLGIELMFETNLHPAIISACKNLEELDIYLDCLEDNELEKFSCFKIIYKSLPTLRKKARFQEF